MQAAPVIIQQQPTVLAAPARAFPVQETRVLGILQIFIGTISLTFGIAVLVVLKYWAGHVGFSIWGGSWIVIGGILGVCSASNPTNSCLNGTNMAFSIVSCFISFIEFIIYCFAVTYYRNSHCKHSSKYSCTDTKNATGIALYSVLLVAMVAEFGIALAVSIYCSKYGCGNGGSSTGGVIIQPAQPHPAAIAYSNQPAVVSFPNTPGFAYSSNANQQGQMVPYTTAPTSGFAHQANPVAITYS